MSGKKIICLDAGHYAKQNRSPAVPEYYESDFTWKFHLLLKAELESLGFAVRTTRAQKDKDVALTERGRASRGCDLFLSIHSNAVDGSVHENTDYPLAIVSLDGESKELGNLLASAVKKTMQTAQGKQVWTKANSRGTDWYGVLRGAAEVGTSGIILEHSFHTCTRSARWLMDEENLVKLAQAEARVLAGYFGVEKPGKYYRVQIGAYTGRENAEKQLQKARDAGFTDAFIQFD